MCVSGAAQNHEGVAPSCFPINPIQRRLRMELNPVIQQRIRGAVPIPGLRQVFHLHVGRRNPIADTHSIITNLGRWQSAGGPDISTTTTIVTGGTCLGHLQKKSNPPSCVCSVGVTCPTNLRAFSLASCPETLGKSLASTTLCS